MFIQIEMGIFIRGTITGIGINKTKDHQQDQIPDLLNPLRDQILNLRRGHHNDPVRSQVQGPHRLISYSAITNTETEGITITRITKETGQRLPERQQEDQQVAEEDKSINS